MRETLYLCLSDSPEAEVEFGVAGADPRALGVQRGPLAAAATLSAGRRLVVFVPGADVRLSTVKVPARQPAKVLQAVPYALEDQVADDIDTLHFAIGPRVADGSHPVAIVSRARMNTWRSMLRAHGLQPEWLVPGLLALPAPGADGAWSALAIGAQVMVRNDAWSGFTCDAEDLENYLRIADPARRHALRLFVAGESDHDWSRLDWPLTLLPHSSALGALAAHFKPENAINLLQGSHAQVRDVQRLWQPWKLAAALLLAWVGASGLGFAIDTWRLETELQRQDQANVQRFQQLFPEQTRVVDLEAQLDQQMKLLSGAGGAGGPFPLLESLARALSTNPGLKLTGMQYREGALFLSMTATDLQVLENLRNGFAKSRGAVLDVQSANAESGGVQIRARLSAA